MPYKLQKADNGKYFVVNTDTGKKHSDKPMPKFRATAQMRALYAAEKKIEKEFLLDEATTSAPGDISVYKQDDGSWRWVLISSNAFRDRDREIVSQKALEDDCERADREKDYGPLRWWHVAGAELGECDFNAMHGRMLIESGTFIDPRIGEAVAKEAPNLQVSLGFTHPLTEPDQEGVFHQIRRFERSLLPRGRASNPLTAVPAVHKFAGGNMVQDKLKALGEVLRGNDELVKLVLSQAENTEKAAEVAGTAFKEQPLEPTEDKPETLPVPETTQKEETQPEAAEPEGEKPMMGDLSPEQAMTMFAGVLQKMIAPLAADVAMLKQANTAKDDTQAALREAIGSQANQIKTLTETVKELQGEQPRAVTGKGYRASQDAGTVVKETKSDPWKRPEVDPTFLQFLKQ